jgi:hypothetical protein
MNKKQALTMSALAALFLVACGEASSVSSSQSSASSASSTTPSSSTTTTSEAEEVDNWGVVNGDFQTEVPFGTAEQPGLWNVFSPGPVTDGITATSTYKTEGTNKYGAYNIASIDTNDKTTEWYHAQFRQNGIYLNAGGSYILSFRVRSLEARTIRVQIQGGGLTSKPTNLDEVQVLIGTTWETKIINFTAPSDAFNAELQFGLGPDTIASGEFASYSRKFGEVHLDDVKIELGEPLPNTAPRISGGDLIAKAGESLLVKSGLVIRDDYDRNLTLNSITALDITQGPKLVPANPTSGFYTFLYTARDSEGLVGTHERQIIVTDQNQLINNTQFNQFNSVGLPSGWSKSGANENDAHVISTGVRPIILPTSLLGNIGNGNFEQTEDFSDTFNWATYQGDPVLDGIDGEFTQVESMGNSYMKYVTESVIPTTQFYHAQLQARNVRLPKGDFTLSFKARAAATRTIRVALAGGGIVSTGRAIDEVPVLLSSTWATYTIDFSATAQSNGSQLQFFFGPDSGLPENLLSHARKTDDVFLDDITFLYRDANSPVATMIPTMAIDLLKINNEGNPWDIKTQYNVPFFAGNYKLNFKAYADIARPVMLIAEGDGGVVQPRFGAVPQLTTTPQAFTYDVTYAATATNTSYGFAFFMGSYKKYSEFKGYWPNISNTTLAEANNVLTTVYLFDFMLTKVN